MAFISFNSFILQESYYEEIVREDIKETFSSHDIFSHTQGLDLDALYRVCIAYAQYDEETGYFECLSFLAASILLHVS